MTVPPALQLDPLAADLSHHLQSLPTTAGIYALKTPGHQPHLSWSSNLRARLTRLLTSTQSRRENLLVRLKENLACIDCWPTGSKLESALLMHALVKRYFPGDYLVKSRLRLPWFVTLTSSDPFPRLAVTNRIHSPSAPLFGPFLTRDLAQLYEQNILGLFQIRRCVDALVPAPDHPGCIYGEMSQCLKPCQSAVTPEEYATEAARVGDFLSTNGKSLSTSLQLARDRAAEATEFEQAAYLHKRLERVKDAANGRDPVIRETVEMSGVALTRGIGINQFRLWLLLSSHWQEPLTLDFSSPQSSATSLDRQLRETISAALAAPSSDGNPIEELAIFSRWYYSSWRDGEWFPFRTISDLNYRKLVREISNMVKGDMAVSVSGEAC